MLKTVGAKFSFELFFAFAEELLIPGLEGSSC